MNNKKILSAAICMLALTAGSFAQAKKLDTRSEKVSCTFKRVSDIVENGSVKTLISESVTNIRRTVVSADGKKEKISTAGETAVKNYELQGQEKALTESYSYTYSTLADKKTVKLGEGYVKVSMKAKTIRTGKDGYQFFTAEGKKEVVKSEYSSDTISQVKGNKSREVSIEADFGGKKTFMPIYDYETVTEVKADGTKVETTTLKTPYTENYGQEETTKVDTQVCVTSLELRN